VGHKINFRELRVGRMYRHSNLVLFVAPRAGNVWNSLRFRESFVGYSPQWPEFPSANAYFRVESRSEKSEYLLKFNYLQSLPPVQISMFPCARAKPKSELCWSQHRRANL
jgi:hypothetical protein